MGRGMSLDIAVIMGYL